MDTLHTPSRYQVYVLRLWQEHAASAGRPAEWRFVLEEPKTGQRRGFASLQVLMAFLQGDLVDIEPSPSSPPVSCDSARIPSPFDCAQGRSGWGGADTNPRQEKKP